MTKNIKYRSGDIVVRQGTIQARAVMADSATRAISPAGQEYDLQVVMSTEDVASDGMIVYARAWERDLNIFRSNPVLLWQHMNRELPVGNVVDVQVIGNMLVGYVKFHELTEMARNVKALYESQVLRAFSVGFSIEEVRDYWDKTLTQAELDAGAVYACDRAVLRELSCVNVPADANALATGRALDVENTDKNENEPIVVNEGENVSSDSTRESPAASDAQTVETLEPEPTVVEDVQQDDLEMARMLANAVFQARIDSKNKP